MKEVYKTHNFRVETLRLIDAINKLLNKYHALGIQLTIRQIFYALVTQMLVEKEDRVYKKIVRDVGNARLAGLIDWDMIEDRARETEWLTHWNDPAHLIGAVIDNFRIDKWAEQKNHIEVMCEKDTLSGTLVPICKELDVRFIANRGYSSLGAFYLLGKRIYEMGYDKSKEIHVIYFGDHDPSGLDMDRDITDRLWMFADCDIHFKRVALTLDQVDEHQFPSHPTKIKDSRSPEYTSKYGDESWELDAMEPLVLIELLRKEVIALRDEDIWEEAVEKERLMLEELQEFVDDYGEE